MTQRTLNSAGYKFVTRDNENPYTTKTWLPVGNSPLCPKCHGATILLQTPSDPEASIGPGWYYWRICCIVCNIEQASSFTRIEEAIQDWIK